MNKRKCGAIVSCLVILLTRTQPAKAVDPNIEWQVLETPHFEFVYDASQQHVANDFAKSSEAAFSSLVPIFKEFPEKTIVWLNDSTDLANGSASPIPYPLIIAYPTLPSHLETIGEYSHWSQELMTHEYTHILTFEPAHGVMAIPRWFLGRILSPNALLPRWYLEGIAVETETLFGPSGRLRSLRQNAVLRAMALDQTLRNEDLPRINETSITTMPQGSRPYLFGSLMWGELVNTGGGMETMYTLTQRYARRLPYLIHGPVEDLVDKDYNELLTSIYDKIQINTLEQKEKIQSHWRQQDVLINQEGLESHSPRVSPDGMRLVFMGQAHNQGLNIQMLTRNSTHQSFADKQLQPEVLVKGKRGIGLDWLTDGSAFVYDDINTYKDHYYYSDLYIYEFSNKKSRQLTYGLRAREPRLDWAGKHILFVQLTPGSSQLARVDLNGKNLEILYIPTHGSRISQPAPWGPQHLVFLERNPDGKEQIISLDLMTRETTTHLPELNPVISLQMKGNDFLVASGRNGTHNLYFVDHSLTQAKPLTNSLTGVFDGEWDPYSNELVISQYRGDGLKLHALRNTLPESMASSELPHVTPFLTVGGPQQVTTPAEFTSSTRTYNPYKYLLPRYWMPFVYPIEGGALFTAQTSASDPIGLHAYTLFAGYNTFIDKPSLAFTYGYRHGTQLWSLSDTDDYYYVKSASDLFHDSNLLGSLTQKLDDNWSWTIGWSYRFTTDGTDSAERHGPRLSLAYSDLEQKGDEISPEKGKSAVVGVTNYFSPDGESSYYQLFANGSVFFSSFLPKRHVISLAASSSLANSANYLVGATTRGVNYSSSDIRSSFLMRGYPSGTFVGRAMLVTSEEYRFPVAYPNWGYGSAPGFIRRLHGLFFSDQVTLDGFYYDKITDSQQSVTTDQVFASVGAELNADLTLFYHYPASLRLGLYYGFNESAYGGKWVPFIGLGL